MRKTDNRAAFFKSEIRRFICLLMALSVLVPAAGGLGALANDLDDINAYIMWNSPTATTNGAVVYTNGVSTLNLTPLYNEENMASIVLFFALPKDQTAEPYEVEIRVPMYIFERRDPEGRPLSDNPGDPNYKYLVTASEATSRGKHSIWSVPGNPNGFVYSIDEETKEFVLQNWMTLTDQDQFNAVFEYRYIPSLVADGYTNDNIKLTA